MGSRGSGLRGLDAFTKTAKDGRVKTASGGFVTICAVVVMVILAIGEWMDYSRTIETAQLIVDPARGQKLDINMNITFPNIGCDMISLDVMDVSGEQQVEVTHGITRSRIDRSTGRVISSGSLALNVQGDHEDESLKLGDPDENYCGSCYIPGKEGQCCNTCQEVRDAYRDHGWAFGDGTGVEQCEREHYKEKIQSSLNEGCNIAGTISVNKVAGNFHFAPGRSIKMPSGHSHDLGMYISADSPLSMSHHIHSLSFGPRDDSIINPLDNTDHLTDKKLVSFTYFAKVVATRMERMGEPVIETNQYSVTSHDRDLHGGRDADHPNSLHKFGGIPGLFVSYEISPIKVIKRQVHSRSFGTFLTGICAIAGGVVTIASLVDRGVYHADKVLKQKKNL